MNAPRYRELTVAKIYEMVTQVQAVMDYLPKDLPGESLPRVYLFNVSCDLRMTNTIKSDQEESDPISSSET